jgi:hypothetical protein
MKTILDLYAAIPAWVLLPLGLSVVPATIAYRAVTVYRPYDKQWLGDVVFAGVVLTFVWGLVFYGRWTA